MTRKKLLTAGLGVALLLSFLGPSIPPGNSEVSANPDRLKWSVVDTPSEIDNVVLSPSEVSALAVGSNDENLYAIDIPNEEVYRSKDSGVTWDNDMTQKLTAAGATLPAWDIAVTPDTADGADLVAVISDNRTKVYVFDAVAEIWEDGNVPNLGGLLISDIAFSKEYNGTDRYLAIGTRNPDSFASGDVWIIKLGGMGAWESTGLNMDVSAVSFSPQYGDDGVILSIASDTSGTYLCSRHKTGGTWIDVMSPVEIKEDDASPKENEIIFSDSALPSERYAKGDEWIVYAGYCSSTGADDAYRLEHAAGLEGATVKRMNVNGDEKASLASINYGSGRLMAGEVPGDKDTASALIHICSNPDGDFPEWESPSEAPTGGAVSGHANAQGEHGHVRPRRPLARGSAR